MKNVPVLRFPEFKDAPEWEEKKLGDIADFFKGKNISKADINEEGITPCIRYGELYTHYQEVVDKIFSKTNLPISDLFLSCKDDIVMPSSGETKLDIATASCVIHDNIALGGDINIIRSKQNGIFMSYYLNSSKKMDIAKIAQGDTVVHLYSSQLQKLDILIPPNSQEQQKIADCLSSIDNLITAQSKKVETLKEHKKGLMQQLFTQDDEKVPKLRFPEFENDGEWEEKPIKNIFTIFQGYAFSSNDSMDNGIRWIKIADVGIQKMSHNSPSFLPNEFIEKYQKFSVKQGDYVIALTRPILNNNLKIASVDILFDGALLNQRVGKLLSKEYIHFVYFLLQTTNVVDKIESSISGSEPPNLSAQQIENIMVYIPSKKEQQKIANFLSSIDELITSSTKKVETLKEHKKGLMQQLFPSAKES